MCESFHGNVICLCHLELCLVDGMLVRCRENLKTTERL